MPTITATDLTEFAADLLAAVGVARDEAALVATSLVGANLRGHDSHGVMRLPQYIGFIEQGQYRHGVDLKVERETPGAVVCDGQWGLGQVQAHRLLDLVIPKAREIGVAVGTARDCGHIGRLGEYAERAAGLGLLLLATVNNGGAVQRVAPRAGWSPGSAPIPSARRADRPTPMRRSWWTSARASSPRARSAITSSARDGPRRLAAGPPRSADHRPVRPVRVAEGHDPAPRRRAMRTRASGWGSSSTSGRAASPAEDAVKPASRGAWPAITSSSWPSIPIAWRATMSS